MVERIVEQLSFEPGVKMMDSKSGENKNDETAYLKVKDERTRKGGNYSDVLPLKAVRRDSISNLTSFGTLHLSCKQTQCRFI